MIFHTRDFSLTEKADYFAAAASVLYGLYYAVVRVFRLDKPYLYHHNHHLHDHHASSSSSSSISSVNGSRTTNAPLRLWTAVCIALYVVHVSYLTLWNWDYTYNMAANVAVGVAQNLLWSWFSIRRYRRLKQPWAAWPGLIVAWIVLAMSLELLDFPPLFGFLDAHSLWHLGTVVPTVWWYRLVYLYAVMDSCFHPLYMCWMGEKYAAPPLLTLVPSLFSRFLIKDAQEDLQRTRIKA